MNKYCKVCGCPLEKTTLDRDWCPVCFKIIEEETEEDKTKKRSYVG